MAFKGHFQLKPFHNSMILKKSKTNNGKTGFQDAVGDIFSKLCKE